MKWLALILSLTPGWAGAGTLLATRTLPAGTVLAAADVSLSDESEGGIDDPAQVLGQQLRVMVYQGRRIDPSYLSAPTLVGRNQIVTLIYENAALRIEAEGRALSAGSIGQTVRVMNSSSRVTVSGRVAPDGTVVISQN
ncbi:flagellar basal body P-ring formation chaperone FlgA [Paracoccus sp. (in: a-proteobacteria)]|uniref:flagellar basal body P-ring formation chaperone FlgA n=1 Tax=Paracoccus sp. TaxID=267 RepID=UPI00321FA16F